MPSNSNHQEKQLGIDRISEGLADIVAKVASVGLVIMTLAWHDSWWISVWSMAYFASIRELNNSEVK